MVISRSAVAGTHESSDILIMVSPDSTGVRIDLQSSVDLYYHDTIVEVMTNVLQEMKIESVKVEAVDHGALDCTIRARLTTAIKRAVQEEQS